MKIPRNLNGADFAATLVRRWRYGYVHQSGSHIIIETGEPFHQRLSVPNHRPIKSGTLSTLIRLVADHNGVTKQDILNSL
jgi:predicted RNA binding protein YcfA (HicA-like mRNA interferase family)